MIQGSEWPKVFFPEDECSPGHVFNLEINLVQSEAKKNFLPRFLDVPTCLFRWTNEIFPETGLHFFLKSAKSLRNGTPVHWTDQHTNMGFSVVLQSASPSQGVGRCRSSKALWGDRTLHSLCGCTPPPPPTLPLKKTFISQLYRKHQYVIKFLGGFLQQKQMLTDNISPSRKGNYETLRLYYQPLSVYFGLNLV